MTTQTEALKMALEALENMHIVDFPIEDLCNWNKAITAIKKALAQPEQERCVGCEACIDTACGRDECPKGWPKAAQPEHSATHGEPVAWMNEEMDCIFFDAERPEPFAFDFWKPLYTTPPTQQSCSQRTAAEGEDTKAWVGLTDDDKMAFLAQDFGGNRLDAMDWAEAKLKEKNT